MNLRNKRICDSEEYIIRLDALDIANEFVKITAKSMTDTALIKMSSAIETYLKTGLHPSELGAATKKVLKYTPAL